MTDVVAQCSECGYIWDDTVTHQGSDSTPYGMICPRCGTTANWCGGGGGTWLSD